jgi:hypothetical protein
MNNEFVWTDAMVIEFAGDGSRQMREQYESMLKDFKASKQPKPEWEILSYCKYAQLTDCPPEIITQRHLGWNMAVVKGEPIHSVRRLSDWEVFTVGEIVNYEGHCIEILSFKIEKSFMEVIMTGSLKGSFASIERVGAKSKIETWDDHLQKLSQNVNDDLPPAANGKIPVWLTPEQEGKLRRLLALFIDPMAGAVDPGIKNR